MTENNEEKVIDYAPTASVVGRKRWYLIWGAMAMTWGVVAALWLRIDQQNPAVAPDNQEFTERLEALETAMNEISETMENNAGALIAARPSELPDTKSEPEVKKEEFAAVGTRINTLEEELKKLKSIETELVEAKNKIEEKIALEKKADTKSAPMLMALSQLQGQLNKGMPFNKELQLVEMQSKGDAQIQEQLSILKAHSENGVQTSDWLRDEFDGLAGKIVSEDKKLRAETLWDKTKNKFGEILSVRRVDNLEGETAEAIVARAELALKNHNISEAVLELDGLAEQPRQIAAEWLEQASARVAVEYAIDSILNRVAQVAVTGESTS